MHKSQRKCLPRKKQSDTRWICMGVGGTMDYGAAEIPLSAHRYDSFGKQYGNKNQES